MKIAINSDNKTNRVNVAFDICIEQIKCNAEKGNPITELYVDNDIAADVKEKLMANVENIDFLTVDRRPNGYTGKMQSFSGKIIGDKRYYKVQIN